LEKEGYLTSTDLIVAGKRRKNYRITAKGRKLMRESKARLRELFSEVIAGRDKLAEARGNSKR
jgi:DNA-binding PadR family transcriptional regulator